VRIIVPLCSVGLIYLIIILMNKLNINKLKLPSNEVRLHPMFCIIGLVASLANAIAIFVAGMIHNTPLLIIASILALLGSLLVAGYFGFRLNFDDEKIVYRFFYEKYKIIFYREIVDFRRGLDLEIKTPAKFITIRNYMTNIDVLYYAIVPHLSGSAVKTMKKKARVRKLQDSLERSGEFVFMAIFWSVVCAGWLFFMHWSATHGLKGQWPAEALLFFDIAGPVSAIIVWLPIPVSKRAHSSKLCKFLAKYLIREGYLKK